MKFNSKIMQKAAETVVNVNDITRIANGASIKGDLSSPSDIRVDGSISGNVYSGGRIVVGETANLSGALMCSNLDLWGKMEGEIYVKDTISIKSTSVINGNLHVRKLQVEIGAQINGSCQMITEQEYDKAVARITDGKVSGAAAPRAQKPQQPQLPEAE